MKYKNYYYFNEINKRCFYGFVSFIFTTFTAYLHKDLLINYFMKPLQNTLGSFSWQIYYFKGIDVITLPIILSLSIGVIILFPYIYYQAYIFFAPTWHKKQHCVCFFFAIISFCLYFSSFYLVIEYLIPNFWKFFLFFFNGANNDMFKQNINFLPSCSDYFFIIAKTIIIISFMLQVALILVIITFKITFFYAKLFNLISFRRIVFFICLVIATILTPPDIFSQSILASFFFIIFEFIIFILFFKYNIHY